MEWKKEHTKDRLQKLEKAKICNTVVIITKGIARQSVGYMTKNIEKLINNLNFDVQVKEAYYN